MMLPIDVPVMKSMGIPARSITFSAPMWAMPFAPPPLNTTATFFLPTVGLDAVLSVCALIVQHISATITVVSRVLFISVLF